MATSSEHYDHALHNEEACNHLALSQKFPDWTITCAFYASLHFVTSKIFPFHFKVGQNSLTFNDLESWQKFKNYKANKRHELISDLVAQYCPDIAEDYDWLLSTSWNARYHHHNHDLRIVEKAVRLMKKIKNHCSVQPPQKDNKKSAN